MSLLKLVKNLFVYKEPSKADQFELLEDYTERTSSIFQDDQIGTSDVNKQSIPYSTRNTKITRSIKSALQVDKWNQGRKQDSVVSRATSPAYKNDIGKDLQQNRQRIEQEFRIPKNKDIIIRNVRIGNNSDAFIVFVDGMVDRTIINDFILRPLMTAGDFKNFEGGYSIDYVLENILSVNDIKKSGNFEEVISQILEGLTALFVEGHDACLLIESRGFKTRNVDEPVTEKIIGGPHEAFIENLRTNLTLVRRIIKNKDLITEILPIGKTNKSKCAVMYIEGIVNNRVVDEVRRRIESLDIDFILGNGMLDQLIEDHPFALFPQILTTERPDRTASFLMEGKVIIICDGTPYASVVPITFFHMLHSSEDSFLRCQFGTFLRLIRVLGWGLATLLPGFYIALTLFHPAMIPTELILAIERSRENIPFPVIVEILIMEVAFELIREAGVRVPDVIGQTLGIIGALILGQSAVAANLVSPILVIIVSITGLGSFVVPDYELGLAIRVLKFLFIILAALVGFLGIAIGIFVVGGLACSMKSFGVPFLSPIAPRTRINPDIIIRQPIWKQAFRSDPTNTPNKKRTGKKVRGWTNKGKKGDRK